MKREYKDALARQIGNNFSELEGRIMSDIVRRIREAGEITSTADYQINRLRILGHSSEEIENAIKEALGASYPEMFELYDKVLDSEYVRSKEVYDQINAKYIPYSDNKEMQQVVTGLIEQTETELANITQSMGFYLDYGNGKRVMTPLSQVYTKYLDMACMDIVSGAFDYNSVLRRTVTQLTNSGLRTIDYASGAHARVDVAARRAVMTGISQLTGKIASAQAKELGTNYFEVAWHAGARPSHAEWQGKVWSEQQLYDVCGLGTVTGLLGANCYHEYYPFFPGISERNWSDEWLEAKNTEESEPKEFAGKEYTAYEARQKQRQMELAMRAQRQKVRLMQEAKADPTEIMLMQAKYQAQLSEYTIFSKKMGLKQERERIYLDGKGLVGDLSPKVLKKYPLEILQNFERDKKEYEKSKSVIGNEVHNIADFLKMKYNKPKEYSILKKKVNTYTEIDNKQWSPEFKQKSKDAYDRFSKKGISMSVHALSRLPRLNKDNYAKISELDLLKLLNRKNNYIEETTKLVFFDKELQIAAIKSTITEDIVTIVRKKKMKVGWIDV